MGWGRVGEGGKAWVGVGVGLQRYKLLENFNTEILLFEDVLDFDL